MKNCLLVLLAVSFSACIAGAAITGTYVDAGNLNTEAVDGTVDWFSTTEGGTVEGQWWQRAISAAQGGNIFSGKGIQGDPDLVTTISGLTPGVSYDIRLIFIEYTSTTVHWWIAGTLEYDDFTTFYVGDGMSVDTGLPSHTSCTTLESFLGAKVADANGEIQVYVRAASPTDRTWYDGVSYEPTKIALTSTEAAEGGNSGSVEVALGLAPSSDVTIKLSDNADPNQVELSANTLTFTPSNWNTPQSVTVTAIDDFSPEGTHTTTLGLTALSSDSDFNGYSTNSSVMIYDNDSVPLIGNYVDANQSNTVSVDGLDWYLDGPWQSGYEYIDYKWWYRTDASVAALGNEGSLFEQNNKTLETDESVVDSHLIKTYISGLTVGKEYEVRAVAYGRNDFLTADVPSEWNILAGLAPDELKLYTPGMDFGVVGGGAKVVISALPFTGIFGSGGNSVVGEFQVLLGTAVADSNGEIAAYINGENIGYDPRTWYDGLAYQEVKLDIVETDNATGVSDGSTDTFTVALAENADGSDVIVDITEIGITDQVSVSPSTLTFSAGNYTVPQTVTVTGLVDDPEEAPVYNTSLILVAGSNDANFDGYTTTVQVDDYDCGALGILDFDFNADCTINLSDFATFAASWLDCTDPSDPACADARPWNND
jgi:hypothetical protein